MFAKKVVLTKRIRWFEDSTGSPTFNHCWMIWDRQHQGPPTLAYAHDLPKYPLPGLAGIGLPSVSRLTAGTGAADPQNAPADSPRAMRAI
jgi:hypothetical protein